MMMRLAALKNCDTLGPTLQNCNSFGRYSGYDYLALQSLTSRGVITGVGRQIGDDGLRAVAKCHALHHAA